MLGEVVLAGDDLVGGGLDGPGDVGVEHAELRVGLRGGLLDAGERLDLLGLEPRARDREVLDRALRLRPVERRCGDPHLAHRVVLDTVVGGVVHHGVFPFGCVAGKLRECERRRQMRPTTMSVSARPSKSR